MPRTVAVAGAITASRVPVAPDAAVIRTDLDSDVWIEHRHVERNVMVDRCAGQRIPCDRLSPAVHVESLRQIPEESVGPDAPRQDAKHHAISAALKPVPVEMAIAKLRAPLVHIPDVIPQCQIDHDSGLVADAIASSIDLDIEPAAVAIPRLINNVEHEQLLTLIHDEEKGRGVGAFPVRVCRPAHRVAVRVESVGTVHRGDSRLLQVEVRALEILHAHPVVPQRRGVDPCLCDRGADRVTGGSDLDVVHRPGRDRIQWVHVGVVRGLERIDLDERVVR
mmetsp:Transcript_9959/g.25626  ORF Transcript_9959/g.25626 Transcript_9959/m.25626 type:complete len:279 (+) Transcript_9959:2003-2839(+)